MHRFALIDAEKAEASASLRSRAATSRSAT
jgi:hypothetical protein